MAHISTDERLTELAQQAFAAAEQRGLSGLTAWTQYLADTRDTVNHFRALESADLLYLDGMRLREIADALAVTHQAVADWLKRYGPDSYLTVASHQGRFALHRIPVTGMVQTRREIAAMRAIGRRVAPARWQVGDDADAAEVWTSLEAVIRRARGPAIGTSC